MQLRGWLAAGLSIVMLSLGGAASAQQTTTKEVKSFTVVAVDGNKVILRGAAGTQEVTVPDDFRMTVDGKPVTVADLKPGMRGTATITTTTTTTPVTVTEVRNGEVARVAGNSIIVRGQNGFQMFSEGDVDKRGVQIYRDGQPIQFRDLRQGDRLTATIVTSKPPRVMTQRQVEAALTGAPAAAASPSRPPAATPSGTAGAAPAPAAPAPAAPSPSAAATPAKRLPKTASPVPLLGLLGAGSLLLGTIMAIRRRRHSA